MEADSRRRVQELLAIYEDRGISVAQRLCDRHDPSATAYRIVSSDLTSRILTYGELRTRSERFASVLSGLGVGPGDRVATLMGKSRDYLTAVMGIWRLGAVHVPLFTAFAQPAVDARLVASRAKVVIVDPDQRQKVDDRSGSLICTITTGPGDSGALSLDECLASAAAEQTAAALGGNAPLIQIYTSGTTGTPKAVVVPTRALAAFQIYAEFGLYLRPADVYWCAADPGWAYGLYFGVLATFTTGTPGLMLESTFSPDATWAVLARFGVTNFAAAPTVYRSLRASDAPPPAKLALRCASSAGEPLTPEVNEWAAGTLGLAIHDHYGQTEAGMLINNHHHPSLQAPIKSGSMGRSMPGWKIVVLDKQEDRSASAEELGRVAVDLQESPLAWFTGYLDDTQRSAEKFSADGRWYLTGDVGRMDEDGDFYFSAREDDVIIMAGYRIGPVEVEQVILAHRAVAECAVVAVPDALRGEVLECFVVLRPGQAPSPELAADIQTWVKTRYAAHAYPRVVHFISALPKTPSGKIQRFALRRRRRTELNAN